jgi:hypothetical protein
MLSFGEELSLRLRNIRCEYDLRENIKTTSVDSLENLCKQIFCINVTRTSLTRYHAFQTGPRASCEQSVLGPLCSGFTTTRPRPTCFCTHK